MLPLCLTPPLLCAGIHFKSGSSDSSFAKSNGKVVDTPLTLQQFHERRRKLEGLRSIHFKSGSSNSLNSQGSSSGGGYLEIPRSATLNSDCQRRLIPVEESESSGSSKKGSIRHTRGHRRGKSWGGSKGQEAELGGCGRMSGCDGIKWVWWN